MGSYQGDMFVKNLFWDLFEETSKPHILKYDFYNLNGDDKYEIAKKTFDDCVKIINEQYPHFSEDNPIWQEEYRDNIVFEFSQML